MFRTGKSMETESRLVVPWDLNTDRPDSRDHTLSC